MSEPSLLTRLAQPPEAPFRRLTVYYLLVGGLAGLAWLLFPPVREYFASGALSAIPGGNSFDSVAVMPTPEQNRLEFAASLVGSLAGATIVMIPTAWTYMVARGSFRMPIIRTMMALPIVVGGIVTIVQYSLALAFSLAGIVAGVRFRTTLKNTVDAMFIFAAIGVGLAAGIGAIEVALVVTIFFNYLILVLRRTDFGSTAAEEEDPDEVEA